MIVYYCYLWKVKSTPDIALCWSFTINCTETCYKIWIIKMRKYHILEKLFKPATMFLYSTCWLLVLVHMRELKIKKNIFRILNPLQKRSQSLDQPVVPGVFKYVSLLFSILVMNWAGVRNIVTCNS